MCPFLHINSTSEKKRVKNTTKVPLCLFGGQEKLICTPHIPHKTISFMFVVKHLFWYMLLEKSGI